MSVAIAVILLLLSSCTSLQQNPEDVALLRDVERAIQGASNAPPPYSILVSVHNGVVRLNGKVESGYDRWAVYQAVTSVPGDFKTINLITVD